LNDERSDMNKHRFKPARDLLPPSGKRRSTTDDASVDSSFESDAEGAHRNQQGDDFLNADNVFDLGPVLKRWAQPRLPMSVAPHLDDMVRDVLLIAVSNPRIRTLQGGRLQSYLRKALHDRVSAAVRSARQNPTVRLDREPDSPQLTDTRSEPYEVHSAALEALSQRDREWIRGRFEYGLSNAELAESMGVINEDAARMAVSRAVARLSSAIDALKQTGGSLSDGSAAHATSDHALPRKQYNGPFQAWLADCQDVWLRDTVLRRAREAVLWDVTAAWGMYVRLSHRSSTESRQLVERTLKGQTDERTAAPRRWALTLPALVFDTIETNADQRASQLEEELGRDDLPWDPSGLLDRFLTLAHARDDLECACVLLTVVDRSAHLRQALKALDAQGRSFRFNLPIDLPPEDERLERVSLIDPSAWWGSLNHRLSPF
jgi:RNA polymerase sigma factor (sigma-70 family)